MMHNSSSSSSNTESNTELISDFQQKLRVTELQNVIRDLDLCHDETGENVAGCSVDVAKTGRFVLASIVAMTMGEVFDNDWDLDFCTRCIKVIRTNFRLPSKVDSLLLLRFTDGNVNNCIDTYMDLLRNEPEFQNREKLKNIILSFVVMGIHQGKYDSRWRVLTQRLAKLFQIKQVDLNEFESELVSGLLQNTTEISEEEQKRTKLHSFRKKTLIGLAAIGAGALIGVTGGLAAPFVGAGLANLFGASAVASILGSAAGITVIGSLFGVAGGKLTQYRMKRRIGDIEEFEFCELRPKETMKNRGESSQTIAFPKELHITIVISGCIKDTNEESFTRPWSYLLNGKEQYYLRYESDYLIELGKAMEYIVSSAASFAGQQALKFTLLAGVASAVTWPVALLGLVSVIDNPWGVCLTRSAQVGRQLAEVLLARNQGHRPVTLMGYSLGARVIYYCLMEMSQHIDCEGIIQDVILIGAPCSAEPNEWKKFIKVVAGRIVNGYSREDWLLRFLYRSTRMSVSGVAGLQKVELESRKMQNEDLTNIIKGHTDYPEKMYEILTYIGDIPLAFRGS